MGTTEEASGDGSRGGRLFSVPETVGGGAPAGKSPSSQAPERSSDSLQHLMKSTGQALPMKQSTDGEWSTSRGPTPGPSPPLS